MLKLLHQYQDYIMIGPRMSRIFMDLIRISKFSFVFQSLTTRKIPKHQCIMEHEASRSYQPSNTGIAAYYQADGLALRLPRVPSTHHLHGESPAEEVQSNLHSYLRSPKLHSGLLTGLQSC